MPSNKLVVGLAVVNVGIFSLYALQHHTDHEHTLRKVGMNINLTPPAKLFNFFGSKYQSMKGDCLIKIDKDSLINKDFVDQEVNLLMNSINSTPLNPPDCNYWANQEDHFYSRLINAMNNPNNFLSPLGRFLQKNNMSTFIKNRKDIFNYVQEHPELLYGKPIDADNRLLVITGMHRTGSTLLQNLLAQDPKSRTTISWEMVETIPPAKEKEDFKKGGDRAQKLQKRLISSKYIAPEFYTNFKKVHLFAYNIPEEDVLSLFGVLSYWYCSYLLQDVDSELVELNRNRAPYICRYLHYFLKVLDSSCPPESHWILKNPDNSQYLESYLNEFPNANVIVTHRNPNTVVSSWAKFLSFSIYLDAYNDFSKLSLLPQSKILTPEGLGRVSLKQCYDETIHLMNARKKIKDINPDKEARIFDVSYSRLVADPEAMIKEIYEHFGYEFTPEYQIKLRQYLESHPKGVHGKVNYSLEEFGLNKETIDNEFEDYIRQYSQYF